MKYLLLSAALFLGTSALARACGNGECEPELPSEPEPPSRETPRGEHERPMSTPHFYPCCIIDGRVIPRKQLFRSLEQTKLRCEIAIRDMGADIRECPEAGAAEALK